MQYCYKLSSSRDYSIESRGCHVLPAQFLGCVANQAQMLIAKDVCKLHVDYVEIVWAPPKMQIN